MERVSVSPNPEISILLLDDTGIAELNSRYLHRSGPTDVISFPMTDQEFPGVQPWVLGDVVISVETAAAQAPEHNQTLYEELLALLIHGVLHLLGRDHEASPADARAMRAQEKQLFADIIQDKKVRMPAAVS